MSTEGKIGMVAAAVALVQAASPKPKKATKVARRKDRGKTKH